MSNNTVKVNVKGQITSAIVDSGAAVTILSKVFFEKTAYFGSELQNPDFLHVIGASGQRLAVLGKLDVEFTINNARYTFSAHIVDGLHHSFILGIDFLSATNTTITFASTNIMHIPDKQESPNVCVVNTNSGLARLTHPVEIPARSEMVVQVRISRQQQQDREVLLEAHDKLLAKNLSAAKCLIKVHKRMGVIRIMNPHCHNISLPHNYIVAHVMEIEQKHIFPLDATSQNKSKVPQVNQITIEIQKQKEIHFNLDNADLEPKQKQILLEFLANHRENFALDLTVR